MKTKVKTPRPYGRLDADKIVEGKKQGKTLFEIGRELSEGKDNHIIRNSVWRKIQTNKDLKARLAEAVNSTMVITEKFEDKLFDKLRNDTVEMSDKDVVDSIAKLRNATCNVHRALKLEGGGGDMGLGNPQQVIMINNLYTNL